MAATLAIHAHPPLRLGEIQRAAEISKSSTQNGLRALARMALLDTRQERGRTVYRLTSGSPYRKALVAAALVDVGFWQALAPLAPRLRFAMVIGSFATGSFTESSDIDFLVVGDVTRDELEHLLSPIAKRHDRRADVIALPDDEYRRRYAGEDYLLRASAQSGVLLIGEPSLVDVMGA